MSNEPTARNRVAQSAQQRTAEADRIPALWSLAEQRSRDSFSAPRTATNIYDELLKAYELGVQAGRKRRDVATSTAANDAVDKLPQLRDAVVDHSTWKALRRFGKVWSWHVREKL